VISQDLEDMIGEGLTVMNLMLKLDQVENLHQKILKKVLTIIVTEYMELIKKQEKQTKKFIVMELTQWVQS